jgi:anti-sigma B factor antagonist
LPAPEKGEFLPLPRTVPKIQGPNCYILLNPGRNAVVSLQIQTTRVAPDIVVVHLNGRMTTRVDNRVVEPVVTDLLNQGGRKFIFDLTGVEEIDSTGANILIHCFMAAQKAGAGLRVAGASAKVARLFKITRLDTVLPVYPTVAAACEGFTISSSTVE